MNIVLIGFMGSGKSTLGEALSRSINYPFLDTDTYLENHLNCKIETYFKTHSESEFRAEEKKLVSTKLSTYKQHIIATGGGLPIHHPKAFKQLGFIVYLQTSFKTIVKRTSSLKTRPLINSKSKKELQELYLLREPIYKDLADLIINTDNKSINNCIHIILSNYKDKQV